jgi:predicted nucleotidyltransferase
MLTTNIQVPMIKIEEFCRKWKIKKFSLFGSVLRDDFKADSDVDVLVTFDDIAGWSLEARLNMKDELQEIFGREVGLVNKKGLTNPFRRHSIPTTEKVLYAA